MQSTTCSCAGIYRHHIAIAPCFFYFLLLVYFISLLFFVDSTNMQNDAGEIVDLYIPRKCSSSGSIIGAKDHASVQVCNIQVLTIKNG